MSTLATFTGARKSPTPFVTARAELAEMKAGEAFWDAFEGNPNPPGEDMDVTQAIGDAIYSRLYDKRVALLLIPATSAAELFEKFVEIRIGGSRQLPCLLARGHRTVRSRRGSAGDERGGGMSSPALSSIARGVPDVDLLRALATTNRKALERMIAISIDILDAIDPDPDLEPEDDGACDEDEISTRMDVARRMGPGCPYSDPDSGEQPPAFQPQCQSIFGKAGEV